MCFTFRNCFHFSTKNIIIKNMITWTLIILNMVFDQTYCVGWSTPIIIYMYVYNLIPSHNKLNVTGKYEARDKIRWNLKSDPIKYGNITDLFKWRESLVELRSKSSFNRDDNADCRRRNRFESAPCTMRINFYLKRK